MTVELLSEKVYGTPWWSYRVMVNGELYDSFESGRMLSWHEQRSVEQGYKEALTNYGGN